MKYLVLLLVLGVAYFSWRSKRIPKAAKRRRAPPTLAAPQEMLACAVCGVHVPRSEALTSQGRHYCSVAHQTQDAR